MDALRVHGSLGITGPEEKPVPGLSRGVPESRIKPRDGDWGPNAGAKKKNYQRYPKPPYSYLAMIAMVIQNSPQKQLTLSQVTAYNAL